MFMRCATLPSVKNSFWLPFAWCSVTGAWVFAVRSTVFALQFATNNSITMCLALPASKGKSCSAKRRVLDWIPVVPACACASPNAKTRGLLESTYSNAAWGVANAKQSNCPPLREFPRGSQGRPAAGGLSRGLGGAGGGDRVGEVAGALAGATGEAGGRGGICAL